MSRYVGAFVVGDRRAARAASTGRRRSAGFSNHQVCLPGKSTTIRSVPAVAVEVVGAVDRSSCCSRADRTSCGFSSIAVHLPIGRGVVDVAGGDVQLAVVVEIADRHALAAEGVVEAGALEFDLVAVNARGARDRDSDNTREDNTCQFESQRSAWRHLKGERPVGRERRLLLAPVAQRRRGVVVYTRGVADESNAAAIEVSRARPGWHAMRNEGRGERRSAARRGSTPFVPQGVPPTTASDGAGQSAPRAPLGRAAFARRSPSSRAAGRQTGSSPRRGFATWSAGRRARPAPSGRCRFRSGTFPESESTRRWSSADGLRSWCETAHIWRPRPSACPKAACPVA